jgi:hypothetical protein
MGIFGFLSKAHVEQAGQLTTSYEAIKTIELEVSQLEAEKKTIQADTELYSKSFETYLEFDNVTTMLNKKRTFTREVKKNNDRLKEINARLLELRQDALPHEQAIKGFEVEISPIRYIAELIYGKDSENMFDSAVRIVIMFIVMVFDPLAILLIVSGNRSLHEEKKKREKEAKAAQKQKEKEQVTKIAVSKKIVDNDSDPIFEEEPYPEPAMKNLQSDEENAVTQELSVQNESQTTKVNTEKKIKSAVKETSSPKKKPRKKPDGKSGESTELFVDIDTYVKSDDRTEDPVEVSKSSMIMLNEILKIWGAQGYNDWVIGAHKRIQEATGLTESEQQDARKQLKQAGILTESLKGNPAKLYFQVNAEKLSDLKTEYQSLFSQESQTA